MKNKSMYDEINFNFSPEIKPKIQKVYGRGNYKLLDYEHRIGVIGTRNPSEYGRSISKKIGMFLAKRRVPVVSGMAIGIDSIAQLGANGFSIGVSPVGLDSIYPKQNFKLFNLLHQNGLLVSEYADTVTTPQKFHFIHRNRIIAGISTALILVEANLTSGSMHTVRTAIDECGIDVWCVPGRITEDQSKLCNKLIFEGANILYDFSQLEERYGLDQNLNVASNYKENNYSNFGNQIIDNFGKKYFNARDISQLLGCDIFTSEGYINELLIEGLIECSGNGYFLVLDNY